MRRTSLSDGRRAQLTLSSLRAHWLVILDPRYHWLPERSVRMHPGGVLEVIFANI